MGKLCIEVQPTDKVPCLWIELNLKLNLNWRSWILIEFGFGVNIWIELNLDWIWIELNLDWIWIEFGLNFAWNKPQTLVAARTECSLMWHTECSIFSSTGFRLLCLMLLGMFHLHCDCCCGSVTTLLYPASDSPSWPPRHHVNCSTNTNSLTKRTATRGYFSFFSSFFFCPNYRRWLDIRDAAAAVTVTIVILAFIVCHHRSRFS